MEPSDKFTHARLEEISEKYITRMARTNNLVMRMIAEKHPLAEEMAEAHIDYVQVCMEYYQFWREWAIALGGLGSQPSA